MRETSDSKKGVRGLVFFSCYDNQCLLECSQLVKQHNFNTYDLNACYGYIAARGMFLFQKWMRNGP